MCLDELSLTAQMSRLYPAQVLGYYFLPNPKTPGWVWQRLGESRIARLGTPRQTDMEPWPYGPPCSPSHAVRQTDHFMDEKPEAPSGQEGVER